MAESIQKMDLRYATVTGVCRDDLPDEGIWLYAETIRKIHELNPGTGVEMLAPDFSGNAEYLDQLFETRPEVFAHNVETVPRIFKRIRPGFRYERSLGVLRASRDAGLVTKSNLILGMGETRAEVTRGAAGPARRRHRADHDHAVPAALAPAPPGGALGEAGGVRRAGRRGDRDGLRRRHERAAGPLLLPGRPALPAGAGVRGTPAVGRQPFQGVERVAPSGAQQEREASHGRPTAHQGGRCDAADPEERGAKRVPGPAEQKQAREAKRAEKARRKASTDPADMGRIRQVRRAYELTHEYDKPLPWLLLAAPARSRSRWPSSPASSGATCSTCSSSALLMGVLLAMIVLVRRAKAATYKRYAGQAGSAEVALQMLPKQWLSNPVIAANRSRDVVHRTVGPGGLVLIGEGEPGRVRQLLASEVRKHERVAYGVAVHTVVMGDKEGQVPLARLADHIRKLPKSLQPHQVTDVRARLRALDAVRPPVPVPKGPMPTSARQVKGSRQAMRGR